MPAVRTPRVPSSKARRRRPRRHGARQSRRFLSQSRSPSPFPPRAFAWKDHGLQSSPVLTPYVRNLVAVASGSVASGYAHDRVSGRQSSPSAKEMKTKTHGCEAQRLNPRPDAQGRWLTAAGFEKAQRLVDSGMSPCRRIAVRQWGGKWLCEECLQHALEEDGGALN